MRHASKMAAFLMALLIAGSVQAADVAGVKIADSVQVGGSQLVLNGAGVRKKFFVKVYVGALYVKSKSSSADTILSGDGANRIAMHVLHSEISAEKLVAAWNEGFTGNVAAAELAGLQDRIETFNGYFPTLVTGNAVELDYLPGKGTQVTINGERKGLIAGEDFNRALRGVFVGEKPPTSALKRAMLGQ